MDSKIQRVNNAFDQLIRVETAVRDMMKQYFGNRLSDTSENRPLLVDISIMPVGTEMFAYAPHITAMWLDEGDVFFMIDDEKVVFDNLYTYELHSIINSMKTV